MSINERIAQSIEKSGLRKIDVAKSLNLKPTDISYMIGGSAKNPKVEVLIKLAEICKVDLKWLITGKGEMEKSEPIKLKEEDLTLIPILGYIPAGMPVYAAEEVREGTVPYLKKEISKDAFALKVYGDSMEPELEENDIVVCIPKSLEELPGKGEIVAVRIHTETAIKRFLKCNNQVILTSINSKYAPIVIKPEEIGFLAKVVCKIKKYK
jgi:SOS-response transcriptional repressor LexA